MTENKGDLISREALKKALKSNCTPELCHDYNTSWCERCCRTNDFEDLIDNAPTVAVNCNDCDGYEAGYSAGLKDAERPQGEWNYIPEGFTHTNGWECSNCKMCYHTKVPYFGEFNFCPNCGAEMKTRTETD